MPRSSYQRGAPAIALAVTAFCTALSVSLPAAAQFDPNVMQKWATVTVVHYAATGEFSADELVVDAGTGGLAAIKNRVEFDFDWD